MKGKWRVIVFALSLVFVAALGGAVQPALTYAANTPVTATSALERAWYSNCVHIVRFGETLSMIAARYGTTVYALMRANFIANPNLIYAGMQLRVPCIAYVPPTPCVRAYYIVQPGDNLYRIGVRFGVNYYTLAYFNGLPNPNRIFWGMRLAIPCSNAYAPTYSPYSNNNPYAPNQNPYVQSPPTGGTQPPPTAGSLMVTLQNIAYHPAMIDVHVGQMVMWRNNEASAIPHTTTSGTCSGGTCTANGTWDSPQLNPGGTFSFTFNAAGTFTYFCRVHGAAMQGTVVVSP